MSEDTKPENQEAQSISQNEKAEEQPKSRKIDVLEKTETAESTPASNPEQRYLKFLRGSDTPTESIEFDAPEPTDEDLKDVYKWAASGVSESISDLSKDKFYETPTFRSLRYKLENTDSGLSLLIGLQGTGKSRILRELETPESYLFKWTRNWQEDLWQNGCCHSSYHALLAEEYEAQIHAYHTAGLYDKANKAGDARTVIQRQDYSLMEAFLGRAKCKELRSQAISLFIDCTKTFLIDMPDYSKSNANALVHDVTAIQEFWQSLKNREHIHIVIAIQKELLLKAPNFFWSKTDRYEIQPLTTQQLIDAYKLSNPGVPVFEPEALQLLAELSRGIFRRFKRYTKLTIEANDEMAPPISRDLVEKTITEEEIFQDLDQELEGIFILRTLKKIGAAFVVDGGTLLAVCQVRINIVICHSVMPL